MVGFSSNTYVYNENLFHWNRTCIVLYGQRESQNLVHEIKYRLQ